MRFELSLVGLSASFFINPRFETENHPPALATGVRAGSLGEEVAVQLKASTDYGLRAVLYLAQHPGINSSKDIAEEMAIPRDYLIQLAQLLRNAKIITAYPGKNGGYRLARDPHDITLLDIINALEEELSENTRARREERSTALADDMREVYELVLESYDAYLDSINLGMLLEASTRQEDKRGFLAQHLSLESERLAGCSSASKIA